MIEQTATMTLTLPSDREILVTRTFDAPRRQVWEALTRPDILMQWFWGPNDWRLAVCEIDLTVGGKLRYVWRTRGGDEMGLSGTFKEIAPPERLVHTELFDEDWTGGETVVTTVLTERNGKTTLEMTVLYSSKEARDASLETPMEEGMAQTYERLDAYLASAQ